MLSGPLSGRAMLPGPEQGKRGLDRDADQIAAALEHGCAVADNASFRSSTADVETQYVGD